MPGRVPVETSYDTSLISGKKIMRNLKDISKKKVWTFSEIAEKDTGGILKEIAQ